MIGMANIVNKLSCLQICRNWIVLIHAYYFIQTKGVGKEFGLKIGQRNRLSDVDIAQLRDLYFCNQRDAREKGLGE